eukprot:GHUV01035494.1.p1 GENE.GHUV01035494.1~~GHUV01035494.1.p1  ORF type:complete len:165 (+),score=31.27 GHUV01035494.1:601-1095(+)
MCQAAVTAAYQQRRQASNCDAIADTSDTCRLSQLLTCSAMGTSPSAPLIVTRAATVCGSVSNINLQQGTTCMNQRHVGYRNLPQQQVAVRQLNPGGRLSGCYTLVDGADASTCAADVAGFFHLALPLYKQVLWFWLLICAGSPAVAAAVRISPSVYDLIHHQQH